MTPKFINKLHNQRVLILGGSSGIGFAVAEAAIEHGADVIISGSNQVKLQRAVERLKEHVTTANLPPRHVAGKPCDLSSSKTMEDDIISLLQFATEAGKIDHVVFTAGDGIKPHSLDALKAEDIPTVGMVRVTGSIMLAKHLGKYMSQSTNSSFTLTGGGMAWRPSPGWSTFATVLGSVESLARGLAIDLKPIRVNCVIPGAVRTELFDTIPSEHLEATLESMRKDTIMHTVGTPEELAEVYLFLMKSTFSTGTTVTADGGRMVGDSKATDIMM